MKNNWVLGVALVLLLISVFFNMRHSAHIAELKLEDHLREERRTDSLIAVHDMRLDSMARQTLVLTRVADSLRFDLSFTLERMKVLTKPVVTKEIKTEAKLWIDIHNSSLGD
jgi:hypothetical protein